MHNVKSMNELVTGPALRFADWPNDQVPRRAAGVYTVWRHEEFIYAGMSGRGANAEDFVASQGPEVDTRWPMSAGLRYALRYELGAS
jgi:hypothetical protein